MTLFADGGTTASEAAGWITAATTTGSTGILIVVLRWIFYVHLPAKDAQIHDLISGHRADVKDRDSRHQTALESVIEHCKEEMTRSSDSLEEKLGELKDSIGDLSRTVKTLEGRGRPRRPPPTPGGTV